jgi:hypothetical protein
MYTRSGQYANISFRVPAPTKSWQWQLSSLCGNLKSSASAPKGDLKMQAICHG